MKWPLGRGQILLKSYDLYNIGRGPLFPSKLYERWSEPLVILTQELYDLHDFHRYRLKYYK